MTAPTQQGVCRYFGIEQLPFSIAPDPRYLYLGDKHQEALAHLFYGIGNEGGFIVLSGEVGTGKTTLCRALLQQLPETTDVAYIVNPRLTANELLQTLCDELGLFYDAQQRTNKVLLDILTRYLLVSHSRGRHTLLIVDEAQNLSVDVLEQIRLLTNLETDEKKLLQLVLIGQPELGETLASPALRQLAQRVTARYHLPTLTRAETARYVQHRLCVSGYMGRLFSAAALRRIHRATRGTPRLINRLCDRCMLGAYVGEHRRIGRGIVSCALRELKEPERRSCAPSRRLRRRRWSWRFALPASTLLVLLLAAAMLVPMGWRYADRLLLAWQDQRQQHDATLVTRQQVATQLRKEQALRELALRWQLEVPLEKPVCPSLTRYQLACVELELTPAQVRRLGVLGVVELGAPTAREYRVIAAASDAAELTGSAPVIYSLFWRPPPRAAGVWPYRAGDRHAGIVWLQQRLAWWRGEASYWLRPVAVDASVDRERTPVRTRFDWMLAQAPVLANKTQGARFSVAVQEQIQALQQALGWSATGVADLLTLIKVDALTNADAPLMIGSAAWVGVKTTFFASRVGATPS